MGLDEADHRALGAETFNASWDLLERERDEAADLELLEVALCSRHHWRQAGGAQQRATADWMVSRCLAALGVGPLSLRYAQSAAREVPADAPAWMRASVLEGLARAHAACGDAVARDEAMAAAHAVLATEPDPEDRALIDAQLATVPDGA